MREGMEDTITVESLALPLSAEATMVGYLLEVGWELHLSAKPEDGHTLYKSTKSGAVTRVEKCAVSADAVLELQQAGRLRKKRQFTVNHKKTTVFVPA